MAGVCACRCDPVKPKAGQIEPLPTAEAHLLSAALSDEGFVHILFGRRRTPPETWAALSVVQLGLSVEDGRDSSFGTPRPAARRRRYDA